MITTLLLSTPLQAQVLQARVMANVVPADAKVEQLAVNHDERLSFYTAPSGGLFVYDRNTKTRTQISTAPVWDLTVSPAGNALAYTRMRDNDRRHQFVFVQPVSATTGLATAAERLLSNNPGDVPSISPDGQWVAFARDDTTGVGQSVVVVPFAGGPERVVAAAQPSGVRSIQWSPDGKSLYFGINPPVPFTCAESCLSLPAEARPTSGSIRRVAVAGGPVAVIASTNNPSPGLTPDGAMLVFGDMTRRGFVVTDNMGNRIDTLPLPATQTPRGWLGASTLLTMPQGLVRRLTTTTLGPRASQTRTLLESPDLWAWPSWSQDGQFLSTAHYTPDGCQLRIAKRDWTAPRDVRLGVEGCGPHLWTADGRSIVFMNFRPDNTTAIDAVDVATGKITELRAARSQVPDWTIDGRNVIIAERTTRANERGTVSLVQVALDGRSTVLREISVDAGTMVTPIDASRAIVSRQNPRDFQLLDLRSGETRTLIAGDRSQTIAPPSLSADKQWAAFRINRGAGDNVVELIRLDGAERRTVELPLIAEESPDNPLILPGANALIVIEHRRSDRPASIVLLDAKTRTTTPLAQVSAAGRLPQVALSADGRMVLSLLTESASGMVSGLDLSGLRTTRRSR